MLRYVGVAFGWADRGHVRVHAEFLLEILRGKSPVEKPRKRGILKIVDISVRWWMELIGDWVKLRTFLISIRSRQDEWKRNPNRALMLACLRQVLRLLIFVCY